MEKIYTIPVNQAFDRENEKNSSDCPFCSLYNMLERNEIDSVLGASMMEPAVRIKTNREGFCRTHTDIMRQYKNRLGLGLILESFINENKKELFGGGLFSDAGAKMSKRAGELNESCYVCGKIEFHLSHMFETACLLYTEDENFRRKFGEQKYFCLPHYKRMIDTAKIKMNKKFYSSFAESAEKIEVAYYDKLSEDVSWFCKKFDYRYEDEPWGDAKDAIERAANFFESDLHDIAKEQNKK